MSRERLFLLTALILMGAGWGATLPLTKIAVSEGYRNFGIIFWQMAIGAIVLGSIITIRGRWSPLGLPQFLFCSYIALVGTILPNGASYQAAIHLPAGILSIVIAAVPMLAFPIALALGLDRFSWARMLGLVLGLICVGLLVAPGSLPSSGAAIWVLVALIGPAFYAIEGNTVAKFGTLGLDAVEVLFWASLIGTAISAPLAIGTGNWIDPRVSWGNPEYAIVASSIIHALVYSSYVWTVGRAGPVFAGQVAYLVTGFGVIWAILFLDESYTQIVWIALGVMFFALFLVQPRTNEEVADAS